MAKTHGKLGYVSIGGAIAGINTWTVDYTIDMIETTDFAASGIASYLPGVSRWSGSFSGYKDGVFQTIGTTSVSITLAAATATTTAFIGNAYISGIHSTVGYDGVATAEYDFQGTGALIVPTS